MAYIPAPPLCVGQPCLKTLLSRTVAWLSHAQLAFLGLGNWDSMTTVALCIVIRISMREGGEGEKGKKVASENFLVRAHASS